MIFFKISRLDCQPIPSEFFIYKAQKVLYDTGKGWESLTCFGPLRFKQLNNYEPTSDSLIIKSRFGTYFLLSLTGFVLVNK